MTLLENAVSAVRLGVEDFQSTDKARLVSAVRNITAGVLLLFKEKLRRLSPSNSDEVLLKERLRPVLLASGELTFAGVGRKTVDVQQIRERFEALGVSVDWKRFEQLTRLRNDLEHYYSTASAAAVQGALADAFAILQSFVAVELEIEPLDLLGEATWHVLLDQAEVFEAQLSACRAAMQEIAWPEPVYEEVAAEIRCVQCHSELVKPIDSSENRLHRLEFRCTSCGETTAFEEAIADAITEAFAGESYYAAKDGGEPPLLDCHECNRSSFHVQTGTCLICQATLDYVECAVCGESLGPDDQDNNGLCGYHKWQSEKDD
jgi:hypothetical protein